MLRSEEELESYICDNQEKFIEQLNSVLKIDSKLNFVGRQVVLGKDFRCDLLYEYETNEEKSFIVVELKNRPIEIHDLPQICRYKTVLAEKLKYLNDDMKKPNVIGVFVSFGIDNGLKQILLANIFKDIYFIKVEHDFIEDKAILVEEYFDSVKLDKRIEDLYGKE